MEADQPQMVGTNGRTRDLQVGPKAGGALRTKLIGCPVVVDELRPFLPKTVAVEVLDAGLHVRPGSLREALQTAIDDSLGLFDIVVLGYGLCSGAVEGLHASGCTLVVPRVDDCIALFLGSREEYRRQVAMEPGTYYLTGGWIEARISPFEEYEHMVARWGRERANRLMHTMLKNYKRLAFIRTGNEATRQEHEAYTRETADKFGLTPDFLDGTTGFLERLSTGPWDEGFVVVPPGSFVSREAFQGS